MLFLHGSKIDIIFPLTSLYLSLIHISITEIAERAKAENLDVVELLKEVYTVIEVAI